MSRSSGLLSKNDSYLAELRLFLEDICCDLCLFQEILENDRPVETIKIDREYHLGLRSTFADIRVTPQSERPYFIEVKFGYPDNVLVSHLARKYGVETAPVSEASKIVLVVDVDARSNWPATEAKIRDGMIDGLELEVWTESDLQRAIHNRLGVKIGAITDEQLLDVRERIETALGYHAFGGGSLTDYRNDPLKAELLWHMGALQLRRLRDADRKTPREILPPGLYRGVAILMADLSSFSSFVRDTPDPEIIRESLTSFYTKSRYQIVNGGGMLYQFVGDAVIAFFGIPDSDPHSVANCLTVAQSLLDIGNSVSDHWQRRIDRVQPEGGAHIGLTIGNVELLSLRPFSRTRIGAVSDSINMAARLQYAAKAGQIAVSNSFYHKLNEGSQSQFMELEPLDARNIGRIKAWKLDQSHRYGE